MATQVRARLPHGLWAVLCVYLAFFVTLGGAGVMLADPIGDQVAGFQESVPHLVDSANVALVLVLVISIYMLIYGPQLGALVRRLMPPGNGTAEDDLRGYPRA